MIDAAKINTIVSKIVTQFNPEKILLFGSYAHGTATENSDLDLLIVQDTDLPMHKRGFEIRMSLIGYKMPIDLLIYTNSEFIQEKNDRQSFVHSVINESKVLYERTF